ncbi:selenium cofactor biosynthesis protein YqeC [Fundidesulfovibrio terrae]|uniref:selenium cofactor biosynthesis protein YqeC n=1 Tax=Fundidesulfovibrio terrae TaxID=2922866 RepID=UPI001FAF7D36
MNPLREMLREGERVVAFTGGGGKTTLMRALARQLAGWGARVLTTATVDIQPPPRNFLLLEHASGVPFYTHLHAGLSIDPATGLLRGVEPGSIPELMERFRADYVLVEADRAEGLPLKAPWAGGAAVPARADLVVGVMGLDALGRAADRETVCGPVAFLRLTGLGPGAPIGQDALEALAGHPEGLFAGSPPHARTLAFHNKADTFDPAGTVYGSARMGWFHGEP